MGDHSAPTAGTGLGGPKLPGVGAGGPAVDPNGFAALYGGAAASTPSYPQGPAPQATGTGPGAAPAMRSITRDAQGRIVGTINGKRYYRDSDQWLQADLVDQHNGGSVNTTDPRIAGLIRAGMVPFNEGLTTMTTAERARSGGGPVAAPWLVNAAPATGLDSAGGAPTSVVPLSTFSKSTGTMSRLTSGPDKPTPAPAPSNYANIRSPDAFLPHNLQGNGWPQIRAALGESVYQHLTRLQQRIGEDGSPRVTDDNGAVYNTAFGSGIRYGHIQPAGNGLWIDTGGQGTDKTQWAVTVYDSTGRVLDERRGFTPQDEAALGSSAAQAQRKAFYDKVLESGGVMPSGSSTGGAGGGGAPPALRHGGVVKKQSGGQRLAINGKPAIVGEGEEDEAVLPLSSLEGLVSQAAAKGAQQAMSGVFAGGEPGSTLPRKAPGRSGKAAAGGVWDGDGQGPSRPGVLYGWGGPQSGVAAGEPAPGTGMPPMPGPGAPPDRERDGGGGGGGSYTPFASYTPASYSAYRERGMGPAEKAQLAAITDIARQLSGRGDQLYNVGSGAYSDAVKYYQTLLKGNRGAMMAAVAPSAELIREQAEGSKQGTLAGMGRGGQRDLALAKIGQQSQGDIARLTAGVQPGAAQALGALGGQGIGQSLEASQAAGGLHSNVASMELQARQFEEDLAERSKQFGAGLTENSRQFGTQLTEQSRQFGASLAEQIRQSNMSYEQATAAMAMQQQLEQQKFQLAQQQFQESIRQFNEQLKVQTQGIKAQKSASKGAAWGSGIAAVATVAAVLI